MSKLSVPQVVRNDGSSQLLPLPTGSSTGNPRNKVALKAGRSMIDWMKFHRNAPDPSGTGGKVLKVTPEELAKHNEENDAWIALNGKVYNVTPYMEFHPGGIPELIRGAGINGTDLFNEVHRWVNYESMLKRCCVGVFDTNVTNLERHLDNSSGSTKKSAAKVSQDVENSKKPRYSWSQNSTVITITVTTFFVDIQKHHVTIDKDGLNIIIRVIIKHRIFIVDINFEADVLSKYKITTSRTNGELDIVFTKRDRGQFWSVLGISNPGDCSWKTFNVADLTYGPCTLISKRILTHDTFMFRFKLPTHSFCLVPVGCHVFVRALVDGFKVGKPYTVVPDSLIHSDGCDNDGYDSNNHGGDDDDDNGHHCMLSFIIKVYTNGVLTPVLGRLREGDNIEISNIYTGTVFEEKLDTLNTSTHVYLLAAGTGLTPMTSVIKHLSSVVSSSDNDMSVELMFFNKTEEDITWKEDLNIFSQSNPWFTATFVLSQPSEDWKGPRGRVNKDMIMSLISLQNTKNKQFCCICGPTPFTKQTLGFLRDLPLPESQIHAFAE